MKIFKDYYLERKFVETCRQFLVLKAYFNIVSDKLIEIFVVLVSRKFPAIPTNLHAIEA